MLQTPGEGQYSGWCRKVRETIVGDGSPSILAMLWSKQAKLFVISWNGQETAPQPEEIFLFVKEKLCQTNEISSVPWSKEPGGQKGSRRCFRGSDGDPGKAGAAACEQVGSLRWESLSGMAVRKQAGSSKALPCF